MSRLVVAYGPPGSGKTANADRIREFYGLERTVDEWDGLDPVEHGVLYLTNLESWQVPRGGLRWVSAGDILEMLARHSGGVHA